MTDRQKNMLRAQDCTLELTPFVCMYLHSMKVVARHASNKMRDHNSSQKMLQLWLAVGAHSTRSPGKALSRIRFMVKRSLSGLLT